MDRRRQRLIALLLILVVAIVLYKSLGSTEYAVRRGGAARSGAALSSDLNLRGLKPANSTLGVCTSYSMDRILPLLFPMRSMLCSA